MSKANEVRTDRLYTTDHEWATITSPTEVVVGITPFAIEQLGDITLVAFDVKPGDHVEAGKTFGTVESVKTVSDLFAPLSGTVLRINPELDADPEVVNRDCWDAAWMIAIAPDSLATEQPKLLSAADYTAHIEASAH
jgi:glycine cleavage system H protein